MKFRLLLIFTSITLHSFAQQTLRDFVYDKNPIVTWLGIDYTAVRFIDVDMNVKDDKGNVGIDVFRTRYFREWNDLVLNESKKYDVAKAFRLKNMYVNIDAVNNLNATADLSDSQGSSRNLLPSDLKDMVQNTNFGVREGYGILMIAEELNKRKGIGVYHMVLIDMNTQTIIHSERVSGEVGGFGVRNYYAGSIYESISSFGSKIYPKWVKSTK